MIRSRENTVAAVFLFGVADEIHLQSDQHHRCRLQLSRGDFSSLGRGKKLILFVGTWGVGAVVHGNACCHQSR
jgi:hypothetical protein